MTRASLLALLALALAGTGCFASTNAARQNSTLSAESWVCLDPPIVSCPRRPAGQCDVMDYSWVATCPEDGTRYVCRFASQGATAFNGRANDRRVFCQPRPEDPT